MKIKRFFAAAGLLSGFVCVGGCQESLPKLYPVEVELVQEGKPVVQGGLLFLPENPARRGIVYNAEHAGGGLFKGRVLYNWDGQTKVLPGVAAGNYQVVYHPASDGQRTNLEVALKETLTVVQEPTRMRLELPKVTLEPQTVEPPEAPISPPERGK
ncbi:MAG: hypothetical protein NTV55_13810 [Planctomycetota bacterium]|nr:hypothetical protein [Planctomycetota bacterium]